jgi:O-antigen/teichoic acid export membrane protein
LDNSFKKIFKASGASAFGQVVNIINQLLLVPIYIKFWGANLYGEWLILSAAPSLIAMAGDLGFGTVAANEMNLCVAKNQRNAALKAFQNTWIVISVFSILFLLIAFLAIHYAPVNQVLNIRMIQEGHSELILLLFLLNIVVIQQNGLLMAGLRCEGNYVIGMTIGNISRATELILIVVALTVFNAQPINLVIIILSLSIITSVIYRLVLHKRSSWIQYGTAGFSLATIKQQLPLALSFLSFPITQAFSIQGALIIVGSLLGPAVVVVFSTTRTFMNVIKQVVSTLNASIWPELTTAYGQENFEKFRKIFVTSLQVLTVALVCFNVFVWIVGKPLFLAWTKNKVDINEFFFYSFALITSMSAVWNLFGIVQGATNKAKKYAFYNLVSIGILIAAILMFGKPLGLTGVLLALFLSELFMLLFVVRDALGILNYPSFTSFITQFFTFRLKEIKFLNT